MNTSTLTNTKRSYHPLVIFFYYAKLLSTEQLDQIPKTTIDYWKITPHADMFGYEWVSSFYDNYEDFNSIQKHKIIFKSARLCCKLFTAFSSFSKDIKSYTKIFKNNVATVIQTIDYLAKEIPLNKACSVFNISTQKFYRLKNKLYCSASVLNHCFKTHPQQLTIAECSAIKEAINDSDNERKKLATIWYKLLRESRLFCSRSTFYKYANLVSERIKKLNYEKTKHSISSSRIFEYIHIDTTLLPTLHDGIVRAVIIKDNFLKKILHYGIVDSGSSVWIAKLLEELFVKYQLHSYPEPITIVSDGGSENKGSVNTWLENLKSHLISKQTAKTKEFIYTNNEIESTFNIFKNEFLCHKEISNKEHAKKSVAEFQLYNDNERYPLMLYGLTPQEVFDGAIIDKNRFKENIQQATKTRYLKNKEGKFCDMCSEK